VIVSKILQKETIILSSLRDIRGSTTKGLSTFDFASVLIVAVCADLDVRFYYKRFASAADLFVFETFSDELFDTQYSKKPEAASWYSILFLEACQPFELILSVLHAGLDTSVLMVEAHAVANMAGVMLSPDGSLCREVFLRSFNTVGQEGTVDLASFSCLEEFRV
jgi:hypothetical protein